MNPSKIYSILEKEYPRAKTALMFSNPWQMLLSTILSAQCTDKRVNKITEELFEKYPVLDDYVNMKQETLIKYIKSAGFYKNKSRNILNSAKKLVKDYRGKVPDTMEEMLTLPGVARKTANVVLGNAYGVVAGIAVDTHVKRLSYRIGLTSETNPDKIEKDLMKQFPENKWFNLTYLLIEHGRSVCLAINPHCDNCLLNKSCPQNGLKKNKSDFLLHHLL